MVERLKDARVVALFAAALLGFGAPPMVAGHNSVESADNQGPLDQLRAEAQPAEDYVVGKFRDHDIVFLGEGPHYVQQNIEFLQRLIPKLHAAGVYNLGYEFLLAKDQEKVDKLLNGRHYDESLANDLIFNFRLLHTSFSGYRDVLRVAWQLNRELPATAPRFRIVALDVPLGPTEWSQLRAGEKGLDAKARDRWIGGDYGSRRNILWAEIISRQFIEKDAKALIYAGSGHTSTRFYAEENPEGTHYEGWHRGHSRSAGNLIYSYIGDRAFRISLHGSEAGPEVARAESLVVAAFPEKQQIGVDVRRVTALSAVPSSQLGYLSPSVTRSGAETPGGCRNFTLADVTDGYVYLVPRSQFRMQRRIADILTSERLQEFNRQMQIRKGDASLSLSDADIESMVRDIDERNRRDVERVHPR